MYKVILADDEEWSLYGLQHLIDWEKHNCQIVGTATDGIAALALCRELKPDLLITDICMPEMDGLELARILMMEQADVAVVPVTGYSDIQYAQKAVRLGTLDYLIKQVTAADMIAVVRKFDKLYRERKLQETGQLFFDYFCKDNQDSIAQCMDQLGIPFREPLAMVYTLHFPEKVTLQRADVMHLPQASYAIFHTGNHQLSCYYASKNVPDDARVIAEISEGFGLGTPDYCGISSIGSTDSSFYEAYQQSTMALYTAQYWKQASVCTYQPGVLPLAVKDMLDAFGRQLEEPKDPHDALEALLDSFTGLQLNHLTEALKRTARLLNAKKPADEEHSLPDDFSRQPDLVDDWDEIRQLFLNFLPTCAEEELPANSIVRQVHAYIDAHFHTKISLTHLAESLYINPCYLSTLIRKNTGMTFSELVTRKRMSLAQSLLRDGSLSVMLVAERVGYREYSHFFQLFRKTTGMSPTQYRAQYGEHAQMPPEDV